MIKKFWAAVSAGLKAKMSVRLGNVLSCCLVAFVPNPLIKLLGLLGVGVFSGFMAANEASAFYAPVFTWWKLRGKIKWETPPDFLIRTADKMHVKLNKQHPFGTTSLPVGAFSNIYRGQVVIGSDVRNLSEGPKNAVLAHELAHLRPKQLRKLIIGFYIAMLASAFFANTYSIISLIATLTIFLIVITFANHDIEFDADSVGTSYTSSKDLVSALNSLVEPKERGKASDTHPSVNARVARLLATRMPRWISFSTWLLSCLGAPSFSEEFLDSFVADIEDYCKFKPKIVKPFIIASELTEAVIIFWKYRSRP